MERYKAWDKERGGLCSVEKLEEETFLTTSGERKNLADFVLLQSTGDRDIKGEEVFDGFILKKPYQDSGMFLSGVVQQEEQSWIVKYGLSYNSPDKESLDRALLQGAEVWGNRYDNPDRQPYPPLRITERDAVQDPHRDRWFDNLEAIPMVNIELAKYDVFEDRTVSDWNEANAIFQQWAPMQDRPSVDCRYTVRFADTTNFTGWIALNNDHSNAFDLAGYIRSNIPRIRDAEYIHRYLSATEDVQALRDTIQAKRWMETKDYIQNDLVKAIKAGNTERAMDCMESLNDVNFKTVEGYTPLMIAASLDQGAIASVLIYKGADVYERDENNFRPVDHAHAAGHGELCKYLRNEMFLESVRLGNSYGVQDMLRSGVSPDPNFQDFQERTALMIAAGNSDYEMMTTLLAHRCDIEKADETGKTALFYSVQTNDLKGARLLLEHGANPNAQTLEESTPLHYSSPSMERLLMEYGGRQPVERVEEITRNDALDFAESYHNSHIPQETPQRLMEAIDARDTDRAIDCLEEMKDVNFVTEQGRTPLMLVAQNALGLDADVLTYVTDVLIYKGADMYATDDNNNKPLEIALNYGNHDLAQYLSTRMLLEAVRAGDPDRANSLFTDYDVHPNLSFRDYDGRTPLMVAVENADHRMLETLLKYNYDLNQRDESGRTVLFYAVNRNEETSARMLLERGADIAARCIVDTTPFKHASASMERLLLQYGDRPDEPRFAQPREPVPLEKIVLERYDGYDFECNSKKEAYTWNRANEILREWARTAPDDGSVHRCTYTVEYEDRHTYGGRYDLTRDHARTAELAGHMRYNMSAFQKNSLERYPIPESQPVASVREREYDVERDK